jgi:biotin carboxylase
MRVFESSRLLRSTFFELAVPIATCLAAALGLPANPIAAVENARDKHATRAISAAAGLPTPKHASITSVADVEPAAQIVGFPAVIKPIGMFQSMGVLRVDSLSDLHAAYQTVLAELELAHKAAAGTADYRATVAGLGVRMVLEEFLDGDEQVCTTVDPRVHAARTRYARAAPARTLPGRDSGAATSDDAQRRAPRVRVRVVH